jgi:hypothetical protein
MPDVLNIELVNERGIYCRSSGFRITVTIGVIANDN